MDRRPGVVLDSFGQPVKEAMQSAARLGFCRLEMPAVAGAVEPGELSHTGRRHLLHFVHGLGLELTALGGDFGGHRLLDASRLEERMDKTRAIMEMAAELHVPLITTHLGRVDEQAAKSGVLADVLKELAGMSDRTGTRVAVEVGGAEPKLLSDLLRQIDVPTLGACYDPANVLMDGHDALAGIEPLANTILIARARDAMAGSPTSSGREVPLGAGQLDLPEYLARLDQAGYRNVPFIRRTESDRPLAEIVAAKERLESLLG